ncbi:hypothetical protein QYM36_006912 [Artemia franciscana]|uniref:Zinc transporter 2 n=1 Tax=Artemia franciscana TaxID=6661 RepID=A0AA88HSX1_ARTSF|nr:hypothetical protein QYM36_006912 [Artemia franciscana]
MQNDQLIPDLLLADDRRSNDSRTPSLNFQIDYFAPRIGRSEQSSPDSELLDVPNVSFNSISLTPGVPWYKRIFGVRRTDGNSWLSGGERPDVPLLSPVMTAPLLLESSSEDSLCLTTPETEASTSNKSKGISQLACAAAICLVFMVAQGIGGYLANSLAIMTDAAHMLSDFASFLVSLFALWISQRSASRRMSFGYHRAEVLGALFSVFVIWIITGVLVYLAVERIINSDYEIAADTMIIVAAIGVIMNLAMGVVLSGKCGVLLHHNHSHGGSSHSHAGSSDLPDDMNVRAAMIHVLGDLIQSIGVLIAAFVVKYEPSWKIADPICTFVFSVLVLITTYSLVKECGQILMEAVPESFPEAAIRMFILSVPGVLGIHDLNVWSLTPEKTVLSVHITIGRIVTYLCPPTLKGA